MRGKKQISYILIDITYSFKLQAHKVSLYRISADDIQYNEKWDNGQVEGGGTHEPNSRASKILLSVRLSWHQNAFGLRD